MENWYFCDWYFSVFSVIFFSADHPTILPCTFVPLPGWEIGPPVRDLIPLKSKMESILILSANGSSKSAFARRTAQGSVFCKGDGLLQRGRSFVKGPVFCKGVGLLQRGWSFAKEPVFCKGVSLLQIGRSFAKGPVCCKWAGLLQSGGSVATIFLLLVWMLQIGRPLAWRTVQQFLFLNYPHHPDAPVSCKKNAQHDHFCANNLDH